ncbi:hypothetical protein JKP88DRAFT_246306 [Tribonema minus]|uniref:Uncharacterized protein n=1 Tax=Tribonema minus TaxID=303371 RepID=A0A836CCY1_9STRA|nr:hypothetical protein JKP88DRAFT_246306 [Tribonema minus]
MLHSPPAAPLLLLPLLLPPLPATRSAVRVLHFELLNVLLRNVRPAVLTALGLTASSLPFEIALLAEMQCCAAQHTVSVHMAASDDGGDEEKQPFKEEVASHDHMLPYGMGDVTAELKRPPVPAVTMLSTPFVLALLLLDVPRLRKLLKQPPASPVPAPRHSMATLESLWPSTVHPDRPLFVTAKGTEHPRRLLLQLEYALTVEPLMGTPTELLDTAFWYNIGWSLPELAGRMLCFDAILNRASIDTSITKKDAQRDYMVLLDGVLCIGGEDKVHISQYLRAVNECGEKHKGAHAAMYGRLGYILLVVVAGNKFGVHAMTLEPKSSPQMLVEFQIGTSQGRRDAILTFINITRWLRSVHELSLLPPRPLLTLMKAVTRPSPHTLGDVMMSDTEITMTFRFVSKTVWVPTTYIYVMLKVYGMLNAGIGGALHCKNMKINGRRIELEHPMQQVSLTDNTFHKVELELTPCHELRHDTARLVDPSDAKLHFASGYLDCNVSRKLFECANDASAQALKRINYLCCCLRDDRECSGRQDVYLQQLSRGSASETMQRLAGTTAIVLLSLMQPATCFYNIISANHRQVLHVAFGQQGRDGDGQPQPGEDLDKELEDFRRIQENPYSIRHLVQDMKGLKDKIDQDIQHHLQTSNNDVDASKLVLDSLQFLLQIGAETRYDVTIAGINDDLAGLKSAMGFIKGTQAVTLAILFVLIIELLIQPDEAGAAALLVRHLDEVASSV